MAHERTAELSASPPMFESRFLDFFSRVHPAVPAIVFIPVVVAGIWLGIDRGLAVWTTVLLFLAGIGIWTLTEYWLHRLLFHWQPKFRGGDRLHFIIHGVHHDHPNDAMRLVMPPAVSIPLSALFLGLYVLAFGTTNALPAFSGFITGYLSYDYMHYHLHHHVPKTYLREEAAHPPHAPPLPGPPLRLRRLLASLGRDHGHAAEAAKPLKARLRHQIAATSGRPLDQRVALPRALQIAG